MDSDSNETRFSKIEATLGNTKTILKQNGLVTVTTILPTIWRDSFWYASLVPEFTNDLVKQLLTTEDIVGIFAKYGFRCVSAMNFLRHGTSAGLLNYLNPEGPLDPNWRIASVLLPGDVTAMENKVVNMKQNGTLEKYMLDNDHTSEFGFGSQFMFMSI